MSRSYGSARYDTGKKTWELSLSADAMGRFKRVFPKIPPKAMKVASLSDTTANARDLLWALDRYPLMMSAGDLAHLRRQSSRFKEQESVVDRMLAVGYVPRQFDMALPPREYQRLTADLCIGQGFLLCADHMGVGKTASGICLFADAIRRPALIIVPTHLPPHWVRQIDRFLPGLKIHTLKNTKPYDLTLDEKGKPGTFPDVVITSYSKMTPWAPVLAELGVFKTLIFDEIQALIHDDTARYAGALHLRDAIRYRLGLSGTPMHNQGIEVFNVLNLLGGDAIGTKSEFSREHCGGGKHAEDPKALGLTLRRNGWMVRRTAKEVGRELPALTKIIQPVEADLHSFEKISEDVIDLATTILRSGGTGLDKMQASGDLDWRLREATGIAKAPHVAAFVKMLLESDTPVILSGWHRAVYDIWMDLFKAYKPMLYTGTETLTQKEASRAAFITGKTNLLIISNRSGSGLDGLQERGSTAVVGELDWTPAYHDQFICRLHRDGQPNPVFAHYLVSDVGSDPVLADILGLKRAQIDGICDPDLDLIEKLQGPQERMKHLAAAWLAKHRPEVLTELEAERVRFAQEAEQAKIQKFAEREQKKLERQGSRA